MFNSITILILSFSVLFDAVDLIKIDSKITQLQQDVAVIKKHNSGAQLGVFNG